MVEKRIVATLSNGAGCLGKSSFLIAGLSGEDTVAPMDSSRQLIFGVLPSSQAMDNPGGRGNFGRSLRGFLLVVSLEFRCRVRTGLAVLLKENGFCPEADCANPA
jgi:hypothetical protein